MLLGNTSCSNRVAIVSILSAIMAAYLSS